MGRRLGVGRFASKLADGLGAAGWPLGSGGAEGQLNAGPGGWAPGCRGRASWVSGGGGRDGPKEAWLAWGQAGHKEEACVHWLIIRGPHHMKFRGVFGV